MKRTLPVLLLALAALPACSDGTGGNGGLTDLNVEPSTWYLGVGDTVRLVASGTNTAHEAVSVTSGVSYRSEDPAVASVTADGKVTAVSVGVTRVIAKVGSLADTSTVNVLAAGSIRTFNVDANSASGCDAPVYHPARPVASASHVVIFEDLNNPPGGFTAAEYQSIADEFDAQIYPTDVANFGQPTDLDGNGKVIILYTRAVNELTPANANFIFGGFFYERDLFPRTATAQLQACPTSNLAEMFYVLAPDPGGTINHNVRLKDDVRESTLSTTAHELQHLINHSRRIHVLHTAIDTLWLDEGLSHIAEELVYYTESGRAPRQNLGQAQILANAQQLDDFNEFQGQNTGRYSEYLRSPAQNSPYADNDELETRGATWSFLRYAADRRNGNDQAFWFSLVNSTSIGLPNVAAALGTDPVTFARDWAVSVYTDDAGIPVASQFTQPSWNYRDIFHNSGLGGSYPLAVQPLPSGTTALTVKSGSAGYLKFAVAAGQQADVRVAQSGTTVGGACTVLNMTVGQVQQVVMNGGLALCPTGGATGAEYVLIPFYGSPSSDATIQLGITAANVGTAVGPPSPSRAVADASVSFPLDRLSIWHPYDGGLERRIRVRGHRLAERLQGSVTRGPRFAVSGAEGPAAVTVNLVRTK